MANITIAGLPGKTAVATDEIEVQATAAGASNKVTLSSVLALGVPVSSLAGAGTGILTWLATPSSANLRAALTDEVGTGAAYFVGGALGTPASVTLTNGTGLPVSTGISGLGTNVATLLATFSSANLAAALTDETGTGSAVFGTGPTLAGATLNGIIINGGTDVTSANALGGGTAIDVTRALNTKSVSADTTFTFSGTPANSNQWFGMELSNTDTNPHTITIPSSFSYARQVAITSFVMPASSKLLLSWRYDGTVYNINGDPVAPANKAFNAFFAAGGNDTIHLGFASVAGNIVSCTTQSDSGTATYTIQVNGVNVTGTANSVSSTKTTQSISAAVAVGDRISLVRSANSTCVNGVASVFMSPTSA